MVGVGFLDDEVGSILRQFFEKLKEILLDAGTENFPLVFGRPHQVVVT